MEVNDVQDNLIRQVYGIDNPALGGVSSGPRFRRAAGYHRSLAGIMEERAIMLAATILSIPKRHPARVAHESTEAVPFTLSNVALQLIAHYGVPS